MQTNNTSKWLAIGQTIFYGAVTLILPQLIVDLGAGGAFYGVLPVGVTGVVLFVLNQVENVMAAQGRGNLFGFAK